MWESVDLSRSKRLQAGKDRICSNLDFICHKNTDFLINQKTRYILIFLHNYTCSPLCLKVHSGEDDFSQQVNEINIWKKIYIYSYNL